MQQYDIKGRAVAQYFFGELEKIALSSGTVRRAAHEAARRVSELGEQLGKKRFVPFTKEHRAWWASRQRAHRLSRAADAKQLKERRDILGRAESGGKIRREDIERLKQLKAQGGPTGKLHQGAKEVQRTFGADPTPPKREEGMLSSPRVRAGLAVGAPLAGVGAVYAGSKYLQSQQDPYGGY